MVDFSFCETGWAFGFILKIVLFLFLETSLFAQSTIIVGWCYYYSFFFIISCSFFDSLFLTELSFENGLGRLDSVFPNKRAFFSSNPFSSYKIKINSDWT